MNVPSELGWVQRVHSADEVLAAALGFARDLARGSSGESLRVMKRQIMVDAWGSFDDAYTRSVEDMNAALRHPDMSEGLAALKERRPINFLPGRQSSSRIVALAWPPPSHIVCSP